MLLPACTRGLLKTEKTGTDSPQPAYRNAAVSESRRAADGAGSSSRSGSHPGCLNRASHTLLPMPHPEHHPTDSFSYLRSPTALPSSLVQLLKMLPGPGDRTQGLVHAGQAPYHRPHPHPHTLSICNFSVTTASWSLS